LRTHHHSCSVESIQAGAAIVDVLGVIDIGGEILLAATVASAPSYLLVTEA
jgi:hypothetical protein